jgi:hypothetical protein
MPPEGMRIGAYDEQTRDEYKVKHSNSRRGNGD